MNGIGSGESKLETVISYLLIIGVVSSLLLELVGIFLYEFIFLSVEIQAFSSMGLTFLFLYLINFEFRLPKLSRYV